MNTPARHPLSPVISRGCRRIPIALLILVLAGSTVAQETPASPPAPATTPADGSSAASDDADIVLLGEFVIAGSIAPRRRLDAANAITMLDRQQLDVSAPRSTADALKLIPGFYVESSGGEVRSNVFTRGFPSAGGFEFSALQEDGLAVFSESDVLGGLADNYARLSSWVGRVETVRGGTAGVFHNSAPGGIVNFIGREGSQVVRGDVTVQTSDFGQIRTEAWVGGPLSENTTYAAGFTFRRDDGIRDTGYTANEGYVFHANMKRSFADGRGHFKVSTKVMDDHATFYIPIPLSNAQDPQTIAGGIDIRTGSVHSPDLRHLRFAGTPAGDFDLDLKTGIYNPLFYIGTEFELALPGGFKLQNRNRFSTSDKSEEYLLMGGVATRLQSLANTIAAGSGTQFAAARDASGNYNYRLSYPGEAGRAVDDPANLNGNGLGAFATFIGMDVDFRDFQNDLRLLKTTDAGGTFAAGLYASWFRQDLVRHAFSELIELRNQPRRLDMEYLDAATGESLGFATYQGIRTFSVRGPFRDSRSRQKDFAGYLNYEQELGRWTLDFGIRHERKDHSMHAATVQTANLNAPGENIPALRNAAFSSGAYLTQEFDVSDTAWTAGANVRLTEFSSVYARFVDAYRLPDYDNFYEATAAGRTDPGPTNKIRQLEAGLKYSRGGVAVFLTLLGTELKDQLFQGLIAQPDGTFVTRAVLRDVDSVGLELETFLTPVKDLTIHFVGTLQNVEFANDVLVSGTDSSGQTVAINIKGNRPVRTPDLYFTLGATYRLPELSFGRPELHLAWEHVGERNVDEANRAILERYNVLNAGVSIASGRFKYRLQVQNLLNSAGLTEGDPRTAQIVADPTATYFNARPILPRSIVGSVTYSF